MIHVDENDPVGEIEPSFPYRDVTIKRGVEAKEFYDLESEIGRGKFGTVYRCRERATGLTLAAKFVPVPRREDRRNVEREVDIMRSLQHPRLIQLYDAFDNGKVMCVVLELIEGGELFERVIDDDFVLTEKSCTVFMRQICEGIEFIHKQNILHLDLKPENILCLTKTGNRIKIIDFGLARKYDPNKKLQVLFGTPEFVAPEVVNFDQIGYGTDMWSVGVICYVLLSGLSPFMGETDIETMANVTVAKYDFDDEAFSEISSEAIDFITQLLVKDRGARMSATDCLKHPWLRRKEKPPQPPPPPNIKEVDTNPNNVTVGLETAKENLRAFVERWGEHPNSPYLFDVQSHKISPVELSSSQHSLKGMSPSPCGSIGSSPDSVLEHEIDHPEKPPKPFEHLQNFERRASDSSCVLKKTTDVVGKINLAEEIKKLSDKLFQLATMPTDLVSSRSKLPNGTPQNGNGLADLRRAKFKVTGRDVPIIRDLTTQNSSESTSFSSSTTNKYYNNVQNAAVSTKDLLLQLLDKWDDNSSSSMLESATSSKFDETISARTFWANNNRHASISRSSRPHKSISLEWPDNDDLGQKTISSLNMFFQSRQTTKKNHPFIANSTSSSTTPAPTSGQSKS